MLALTPVIIYSIASEIQDEEQHISVDRFLHWWDAFIAYYPPSARSEPIPPQAPVVDATLQRKQFVEAEEEDMMEDPELNTRRLSCIDCPATMTWNDFWQGLCDKACEGENQEDMHVTEKACEYAARVVNETREMSETILKHFICPSDLNEHLRDGLCDRDGGYFMENGAVFVNPLHVRSERVNKMFVIR